MVACLRVNEITGIICNMYVMYSALSHKARCVNICYLKIINSYPHIHVTTHTGIFKLYGTSILNKVYIRIHGWYIIQPYFICIGKLYLSCV
jgi:hypothetical protein